VVQPGNQIVPGYNQNVQPGLNQSVQSQFQQPILNQQPGVNQSPGLTQQPGLNQYPMPSNALSSIPIISNNYYGSPGESGSRPNTNMFGPGGIPYGGSNAYGWSNRPNWQTSGLNQPNQVIPSSGSRQF
jgi:hypothetical protein